MLKFTSEDSFDLKGRGVVFTLHSPAMIDIIDIQGEEIEIDGVVRKCIGIERFAKYLGFSQIRHNEAIGLLCNYLEHELNKL
jgi:hypothetical protein